MVNVLKLTPENLADVVEAANKVLVSGGVIVYPTDTVYGIGGDATSDAVFARVLSVKKITATKPFSVMLPDLDAVYKTVDVDAEEKAVMARYLPGPYTFLVHCHKKIPVIKDGKLGVRIPDNPFCLSICQKFGKPIITTSANITTQSPPINLSLVDPSVLDGVDLAIDGGETKYRQPSQIMDLVELKRVR